MLQELTAQATNECEIVISDNASTDDTDQVVSAYQRRFQHIHYFKQPVNIGVDRNFDFVATQARGEFCWLMGDDDILIPGAVARVISQLRCDTSLVIVNMQLKNLSLSKIVRRRWIKVNADRVYGPDTFEQLLIDMDYALWNAGNIIFRRSIWQSRNRERYYDSNFIHAGVLFQDRLPGRTLIIADPLMSYRLGNNARWFSRSSEIFLDRWPSVLDSLALPDSVKERVPSYKPWRQLILLLGLRSLGYSLADYRRWIRPRLHSRYEAVTPLFVALIPRGLARKVSNLFSFVDGNLEHFLHLLEQRRRSLRG